MVTATSILVSTVVAASADCGTAGIAFHSKKWVTFDGTKSACDCDSKCCKSGLAGVSGYTIGGTVCWCQMDANPGQTSNVGTVSGKCYGNVVSNSTLKIGTAVSTVAGGYCKHDSPAHPCQACTVEADCGNTDAGKVYCWAQKDQACHSAVSVNLASDSALNIGASASGYDCHDMRYQLDIKNVICPWQYGNQYAGTASCNDGAHSWKCALRSGGGGGVNIDGWVQAHKSQLQYACPQTKANSDSCGSWTIYGPNCCRGDDRILSHNTTTQEVMV